MRRGWVTGPETFEDRRRRMDHEYRRDVRWVLPVGLIAFLVTVTLVVWVVLRVTS